MVKKKRLRVLFIIPPFPARTYPGKTMGPDYLAGVLEKKGHYVDILDLDILGEKSFKEYMTKKWDLIGISYLSFQIDVAMKLAHKCHLILKEKNRRDPDKNNYVPIICGNSGSIKSTELVSLYKYVDIFCPGEGFVTIEQIVESITKGNFFEERRKIEGLEFFDKKEKRIIIAEPQHLVKNIDEYIPKRKHHYKQYNFSEVFGNHKTAQIMTQIGCPFCCVFCGESSKGPLVRTRSIKSIKKELNQLIQDKYSAVYFDDSTFTFDKARTLKIISLMKNYFKKYGLVWGFNTRIDCLDKEILKKSAEAGCKYLFTGVETLVPEVILGMNKIIPRKNKDYPPPIFTPEDYIQRGIEIYQKMENLGIQKSAFLVFGGPKKIVKRGKIKIGIESFNDAKESIDRTVFELKPHFISINILRFIPSAIMSYSPRYEVLRGQKSPFSSGYYSSLYRKKHNIKKRTHKHQIYLAFEAASDFYPIPPKMSPRYCYKILNYLVKQVNQHNKKSETKTIIWVDKEFQKYMPRNKEGIYCLAPFKKISSKTINETKHSVPPSRT